MTACNVAPAVQVLKLALKDSFFLVSGRVEIAICLLHSLRGFPDPQSEKVLRMRKEKFWMEFPVICTEF